MYKIFDVVVNLVYERIIVYIGKLFDNLFFFKFIVCIDWEICFGY